jgi:hypothetical protein
MQDQLKEIVSQQTNEEGFTFNKTGEAAL